MKRGWILFIIMVYTQISKGEVEIIEHTSKVFHNTRKLRVYLPPGYHHSKKSFPVLYMNDGVATFHAYNLEALVDSLIHEQIISPLIIVGIDNGGSAEGSTNPTRDRANEYLPWSDDEENNPALINKNPQGSKYPQFFEEVRQQISSKYRIKAGKHNTALGGASYGALAALFTAISVPSQIGIILLESPSLYVHSHEVMKLDFKKLKGTIIYIGIGTEEGDTESIQKMALKDANDLSAKVSRSTKKIHLEVTHKADHSFPSFALRFPIALKFLFGNI